MAKPLAINNTQFLHVTINIPTKSKAKFVAGMKKLIPLFTGKCPASGEITGFAWPLVASMTNSSKKTTNFLHLWQMSNPARPLLSEVMEVLGADNNYGALDALVNVEIQDLMHSNDAYSPANFPKAAPKAYAHEVLNMTSNVAKLVALESAMPVIAETMTEKFGWVLLSAMVSNTGQLRRFVHLWQIPSTAPAKVAAATKFLKAQPAYAAAVSARTADVFQAISYR